MSLSDEELNQLAILAQQHPPRSPKRQAALRQLTNGLLEPGSLGYPKRGRFAEQYRDIYAEAVQDLLLYVCKNIDRYESERGAIRAWVNMLLDRRFFPEAIRKVLGPPSVQPMPWDGFEPPVPPDDPPTLTEVIKACIESDPDHLFKQEHLRDCPTANFQTLALRRLAGKSWKEIAEEFEIEIKVPTLTSFYSRCLSKFANQLRVYCNEQES
jgi:DNA-directed RNA polymerase specialized sigma24 family protein